VTALTVPARAEQDANLRPLPWRRMAWVTWRQHRVALTGAAALLGALAVYLWHAGLRVHHNGDMSEGDGDPTLTQFGAKVTPNQHALAKQFGLYDNTYDVGTNSAEGHNWLMQGDDPEYTESSAGEYQRSYDNA
jgi:hypothetical protein